MGLVNFFRNLFGGGPDSEYVDAEHVESVSLDRPRRRRGGTRISKRRRSEEQMASLQAGYNELVGAIGSIRDHLEQGNKNQKKLLSHLEHMPELVDGLKSVGASAEQQTEVLGLLKDQLKSSQVHDEQLVDSMNGFNNTLNVMDKSNRASAETIGRLVDKSRQSEEAMQKLLARSEKRLLIAISTLAVVAIVVIGAAVYLGMTGRSGDAPAVAATQPVEEPAPIVHETISSIPSAAEEVGEEVKEEAEAAAMEPVESGFEFVDEAAMAEEVAEDVVVEKSSRGFFGFGKRDKKPAEVEEVVEATAEVETEAADAAEATAEEATTEAEPNAEPEPTEASAE